MNKEKNIADLMSIKLKLDEALVSLDDKNLIDSEKLLLTIVGKVRNSG